MNGHGLGTCIQGALNDALSHESAYINSYGSRTKTVNAFTKCTAQQSREIRGVGLDAN